MRLFVAVWPDGPTRERLSELEASLGGGKGLRLVGATRWHVTLQFLGEVDEELVEPLGGCVRRAAASVRGPLRCELGPATGWFPGARVLQVPAAGLDALADAVQQETAAELGSLSEAGRPEPFNGHLTLGRARGRGRSSGKGSAPGLAGLPFASSFAVRSVDLVQSEATPSGHVYTTLERAELAAEPGPTG